MDLSLIKKRLESSQQKKEKKNYEKIDYKAIFWKPKAGKHQIRIVPSAYDKANPFKEIYIHYGYTKFPIFALNNWGEADPIIDFTKELYATRDKEDWTLAKKLEPKMRVFVPVVVRGEEHLGTRLWEFGKGIYDQLLGIAADEDYGDYTDILNGRDFTVEAVEEMVANRKGIKCSIRVKPKTTPITEDKELLEKLLNTQPNILTINERYKQTYDSLKEILQNWLHPKTEADTETPIVSEDEAEEESIEEIGIGNIALPTDELPSVKKTKSDKFNKLFN